MLILNNKIIEVIDFFYVFIWGWKRNFWISISIRVKKKTSLENEIFIPHSHFEWSYKIDSYYGLYFLKNKQECDW